jgi:hypothetical protein
MLWNVVCVGTVKLRSVWQAVQASPNTLGPGRWDGGKRIRRSAPCSGWSPAGWQFMQRHFSDFSEERA